MTKEEALENIDSAIFSTGYWVPRISNHENRNRWAERHYMLLNMRHAVKFGSETWTNTEEQLNLVNGYAVKICNDLPPIRFGHPLDAEAQIHYNHGKTCPCSWCESKKESWAE